MTVVKLLLAAQLLPQQLLLAARRAPSLRLSLLDSGVFCEVTQPMRLLWQCKRVR